MKFLSSSATLIFVISLLIFSCKKENKAFLNFPKTDLTAEAFIPYPKKVEATGEVFFLSKFTRIHSSENNSNFEAVEKYLRDHLKLKMNLDLAAHTTSDSKKEVHNTILFKKLEPSENKIKEAYTLHISKDSIILGSASAEGVFRGAQTLLQIIPNSGIDSLTNYTVWPIAAGIIEDAPAFEYRGAMLDVSRHFFEVEAVKEYIDLLAYYKYNILHLHLSDDQGWRIEIKAWPKLTEVGGSSDISGKGGFYTQEQYKDLVAYAADLYITIIPEIDMPGHTNAASVSYPFLNGNGKTPKIYKGTKVGWSTFDTRKDTVYAFIDDVIKEVAAITPGPYIHIGGDESQSTKKKDFNYFIERVQKIVSKYDKRMIGWDEVAQSSIDSTAIIQYWHSIENAKLAEDKNMKIILSPATKIYLDMKYDSLTKIGLTWAALIPVDTAYQWNPQNYKGLKNENILGIEAPLWTETVTNSDDLEYLAFPRAIGVAELGWSVPEKHNWKNYKKRLAAQSHFLDMMDVNYYQSPLIEWEEVAKEEKDISEQMEGE